MQELACGALILRHEAAREVESSAGDVRVNIDAAGEDDHPGRVDRSTGAGIGASAAHDASAVDANVLDDAVDAVGRIVDFSTSDPQHGGVGVI